MIGYFVLMISIFVLLLTIDVIKDGLTLEVTAFWALETVVLLGMLALFTEIRKRNDRSLTKTRSAVSYWLLFAVLVAASIGSSYFVYAYSEPKDVSGFARSALIATSQWCTIFLILHLGRRNNRNTTPNAG